VCPSQVKMNCCRLNRSHRETVLVLRALDRSRSVVVVMQTPNYEDASHTREHKKRCVGASSQKRRNPEEA
jgi:hypothetical protein